MVTRRKLRSFLATLGLYAGCALIISYFAHNAFTGNHGLRAKQELDQRFEILNGELEQLRQERIDWQHRVNLMKSQSIDPDMLDERARAVLNYLDPRELTLLHKRP
jgi:cell division protein FtsB